MINYSISGGFACNAKFLTILVPWADYSLAGNNRPMNNLALRC